VGLRYPGLLFVLSGRHGDQVSGRRRPLPSSLAGVLREGRPCALAGAVVTVEADLDRVEGKPGGGRVVVPGMRRGADGLGVGQAAAGARLGWAGAAVPAPVAVHRLSGDARIVAGDRVAASGRHRLNHEELVFMVRIPRGDQDPPLCRCTPTPTRSTRRKVELVFSPFDLETVEVRYHDKSYGTALPHTISRHAHPKAKPETLEPEPPTPTGIDYLALTAAAHHEQLRRDERIGYHALYGKDGEIPGQLSIDDLAPNTDIDHEGEVSA
jgi:hypothetical protein